jgi:hypothetical protein
VTAVYIGALVSGRLAQVDERGNVAWPDARLTWRIFTAKRWVVPGVDALARTHRPAPAPVTETALRIAGGDVLQRVYAIDQTVVLEVENASPEAIAVAFALDGAGVQLSYARKPGATEPDGALAFPVPHRTSLRVAASPETVDVSTLPDAASVTKGWDRVLDRGLRTELPEPLQTDVDAARADLLLEPPSVEAFTNLEAWGFDAEAITMWSHFGFRARRAARKGAGGRGLLGDTRRRLVAERGTNVELLPGFHAGWLGQHLAVHDAPCQAGPVSFAVRWHGARPALLWDVPRDVTITVPVLDPAFSSTDAKGETLLAEPSGALLAMGAVAGPASGEAIDAPQEFS